LTCLPAAALAGIEPVPWHILIENRTHQLAPSSPLYNQPLGDFKAIFLMGPSGAPYTVSHTGSVAPGQTLALVVDLSATNLGPPQSFSFFARAGVEPTPWYPVYAFEAGSTPPSSDPGLNILTLPDGPAVAKEYSLFGFASPGVVVGSARLASSPCPVAPVDFDWKNHGQYVRCVSHEAERLVLEGALTQEEADLMVSAAAESEVGKQ
jgi:hypothetical protein